MFSGERAAGAASAGIPDVQTAEPTVAQENDFENADSAGVATRLVSHLSTIYPILRAPP